MQEVEQTSPLLLNPIQLNTNPTKKGDNNVRSPCPNS